MTIADLAGAGRTRLAYGAVAVTAAAALSYALPALAAWQIERAFPVDCRPVLGLGTDCPGRPVA